MTIKQDLLLKHLDITQSTINRLAQNSFVVKGWSVTVVSGIFALTEVQNANKLILLIGFAPALIFWGLDAYYLRQERLFRKLYCDICDDLNSSNSDHKVVPLTMTTEGYKGMVHIWHRTLFSKTVWPIPFTIILVIVIYLGLAPSFDPQPQPQLQSTTNIVTSTVSPMPTFTPSITKTPPSVSTTP